MSDRVQLSRRPGYRLPPNAVSIAYPTRWRNPYRPKVRTPAANAAAVAWFCDYLAARPDLVADGREALAGHDLACWCGPELACHGDAWQIALSAGARDWLVELERLRDSLIDGLLLTGSISDTRPIKIEGEVNERDRGPEPPTVGP